MGRLHEWLGGCGPLDPNPGPGLGQKFLLGLFSMVFSSLGFWVGGWVGGGWVNSPGGGGRLWFGLRITGWLEFGK